MQLHCLGTAGYHPNEHRHTSCYFVPQAGLVLDAGSGFFRLPPLIQTDSLDILLSHSHLDHILGLTFLLDILHQRPVKEVRVWGESAKLAAVQEHLTGELIFPVELPVQWRPIDDLPKFMVGEAEITWRRQTHPGGSVAYRIDWPAPDSSPKTPGTDSGISMVYATDTNGDLSDETAQWMAETGTLLHECNFQDHQKEWAEKTGHCYLGRVAEICQRTHPRRVLLTHVYPIEELVLPPQDERFSMPVEVVKDLQVVDLA